MRTKYFFLACALALGWISTVTGQVVGTRLWSYVDCGQTFSSPAVGSTSTGQQTVYIGAQDGSLHAINAANGTKRWAQPTGWPFGFSSPTLGPGGVIYVSTLNLFAFSSSGSQLWNVSLNGQRASTYSSPAIGIDGSIYVCSEDGVLYSIKDNGNSGSINWTFSIGSPTLSEKLSSSPSVSVDGTIYFVTDRDALFAVNPNGSLKWKRPLGDIYQPDSLSSSPAIGRDGTIFVGSKNARLFAITDQGTTSAIKWQFLGTDPYWFISSPAVGPQDIVISGSTDKNLYALNTISGTPSIRFKTFLNNAIDSSPAIDQSGVVWVGSPDAHLYGVDIGTGDILYSLNTSTSVRSSPVITLDGTLQPIIFVGSDSGVLAFRGAANLAPLTSSAWPMFRKDQSHSGVGSITPPAITKQPISVATVVGAPVTFEVTAIGIPEPTYQWLRNGVEITGNASALTSKLVIPSANPGDQGTYTVRVSNSAGAVVSLPVELTLSNPPSIGLPADVQGQGVSIAEDTSSSPIVFSVFDTETDPAALIVTAESSVTTLVPNASLTIGTVSGNPNQRRLVITPLPNQFGSAVITLFVRDGDGLQGASTFNLTVRPVNDPPTLAAIANQNVIEGAGQQAVQLSGISAGPANENGQVLFINASSSNPTVIPNPTITYTSPNATGLLFYTPVTGANGSAVITVTVADNGSLADGGVNSFTRQFTVSIGAVNDPPILTVPGAQTVNEDSVLLLQGISIADPDAGSGPMLLSLSVTNGGLAFGVTNGLTFSNNVAISSNLVATGTLANLNQALGTLTYGGRKDFFGTDTLSLTINDQGNTGTGGAQSDSRTILINVVAVNDPPSIGGIPNQVTIPKEPTTLNFTVTDPDSTSINVTANSTQPDVVPSLGGLFISATGSNYTLRIFPANFGTTAITLLASDGNQNNGIGQLTFILNVKAVNNPPTVSGFPATLTLAEDTSQTISFTVNDVETPASGLNVAISSSNTNLVPNLPANLLLSGAGADRSLLIAPAANLFGSSTISLVVDDGTTAVTNQMNLTVTSVNDLPAISPIANVTLPAGTTTNLTFSTFDVETPAASLIVTARSDNQSVVADSSIFLSGSGTNSAVRIIGLPGILGTAHITVTVQDANGGSANTTFTVIYNDPKPVITLDPVDQSVPEGGTLSLSGAASGAETITYQWRLGNTPISGATQKTLSIPNITPAQAGSYTLVANNSFGSATSRVAVVTVLLKPIILIQPVDQVVQVNSNVTFTVAADGARPLGYQWLKDGTPIAGAATNTLTLTSVQVAQAGKYSAVITNIAGSVTSREATLTVEDNTAPTISDIPDHETTVNTPAGPFAFSISDAQTSASQLTLSAVSSNPTLVPNNQIQFGGGGPFRTITVTPAPNQSGTVTIMVTVSDGALTASDNFKLTVTRPNTAPTISSIPDKRMVENSTLTPIAFTVSDAETPDTLAISGVSTNQTLVPAVNIKFSGSGPFRLVTINPATDQSGTTLITITVSDGELTASTTFRLTVDPLLTPPVITAQPQGRSANEGETVQFSVTATGTAPLNYQWRVDGKTISGATNATLSLPGVTVDQAGNYSVVISNQAGNVTSGNATLTVVPANKPPTIAITSPTGGAKFGAPANVTVSATAADTDGIVTKVEFFLNGTPVGEDTSSPYNFTIVRLTPGNYTLSARATDNSGATTVSTTVSISVIEQNNLPVIRIEDWAGTEGNIGNETFFFTVSLSPPSAQPVTVQYATADDTAVAGADYVPASGTLTFQPGETSKTITVDVVGDTLSDAPNETFFVNLSNPVNANIGINQAVGTITDDDLPIGISITDAAVTAGFSGTTNITFNLTLTAPNGQPITVFYATEDETAHAGTDYVAASGQVTFNPGTTTQTITVTVRGAGTVETNQTFLVRLSNPSNAELLDDSARGTITRVVIRPTLNVADVTVPEGNFGTTLATFTVTLSVPIEQAVTVNYTTANDTATAGTDYTAATGTITFLAGSTSQTVSVDVLGDLLNEPDETFSLNLSNASGAILGRSHATATITDDDPAPAINITDASRLEGNTGISNMVFSVRMNAASAKTVSLSYATTDGTAISGIDYFPTNGTLVFPPGTTVLTIEVPVIGDTVSEPSETLFVNLSKVANGTLTRSQAKGTIINDDPEPTLSISDVSLSEGNGGTKEASFEVSLSIGSGQEVTVDYATTDGTATAGSDYVFTSGRLSFPPGVTAQKIVVPVNGDLVNEPNETFFVNLSNSTNASISRAQATATIINDDDAPTISISDLVVPEGNFGTTPANLKVTLSAGSSQTVSVDYTTTADTARADEDFTPATGTLVFLPGETTQTITVGIIADLLNEPDETFTVTLSNASGATLARSQAKATIQNDDPVPSMIITDASRVEGNTGSTNMQFTVRMNAASAQIVTVDFATSDGTATAGLDYTGNSGTLTFTPGQTTNFINVTVLADLGDEPNEVFFVNLANVVNATLTRDQAKGTIIDDDNTPTLSITDVSVTEGNSGTVEARFSVSLSIASGQQVTVDYATADGTATAGTDYEARNGRLAFAPGVTTQTINVPVIGDFSNEPNETFLLNLSNPTNATLSRAQAIGTIINDDTAAEPPVLSKFPDQNINQNGSAIVPFRVDDADTPIGNLILGVTSSDTVLFPAGALQITGSGTNRSLTITPAPNQGGTANVTVSVSDGLLSVEEVFKVTVNAPSTAPVVTRDPQNRTVLVGTTVELTVEATGSAPLTYQWLHDGVNVAGATAAKLSLQNIQASSAGRYRAVVSNGAGSATSSEAIVTVGSLGAKLWDFATAGIIRSSPAADTNGTLYFGSDDGKLYAVSALGVKKWEFAAGAEIASSPAIGADGTIYFGSKDFKVYALRPDGTRKWQFITGNWVDASPAIGADGTIYVGSYDNKLYAINPDGTKKWEFPITSVIFSSAAVGADGTVYFGSEDQNLRALTPAGQQKWTFKASAEIIGSPAIDSSGTIYIGSKDSRLYAINPNGTQKWQFLANSPINTSPAIGPDGSIYFGADNGRLYAVSSAGTRKWDFLTGLLIFASPAVGSDGTVYVTSFDQKLYAINGNGTKRWEYVAGGAIASSPALDQDGVVYFGAFDKKFYAIKGTTGLADSAWPMFRRDLQHTARTAASSNQPPSIDSINVLSTGMVELMILGQTGQEYAVEFSDNLVSWTTLTTFTSDGTPHRVTDQPSASLRARFYRAVAR